MLLSERANRIFLDASRLPPTEREAFLNERCECEPEIRRYVEALLGAAADVDRAIETTRELPTQQRERKAIAGYRLLERIGEGGFGEVFMAEQTAPVRRMVAIKLIKIGMDTKQVIARFEAERQALAMMEHPGIARVFDGGSTEDGRPYFVMELVKGVALTEYCDRNRLSIRERLPLFVRVCAAIQHAHQKGIIHRDIKPSNVLVTLQDGEPSPKVIDFGIAKAIHARLTEKTIYTRYHEVIGTPQYMSPEQIQMSGLDIDTRTDIYSLGVLLYELLVGHTPFDLSLQKGGYAEMERVICEEEPTRPSTRLSVIDEERHSVAKARRRADPEELRRELRGDLDWIVMKALEKDRTRRYASAGALADDVERYLSDAPVLARPPSRWYQLSKTAKRHRLAIAAAAAVFLALVAGIAVATVGLVRAEREAEHRRKVNEILEEMVLAVDPSAGKERERRVEEALARGDELFGPDHPVRGSLLLTWGTLLSAAGHSERAEQILRKQLAWVDERFGRKHPMYASGLAGLAKSLAAQGHRKEAEAAARERLKLSRAVFPPQSEQLGSALLQLVELLHESGDEPRKEMEPLWRELVAIDRKVYGDSGFATVEHLAAYGAWLSQGNDQRAALPLLEEAVERGRTVLGPQNDGFVEALNRLTLAKIQLGENDAALPLYAELMEILRQRLTVDHPSYVSNHRAYVGFLQSIGKEKEAAEALQKLNVERLALRKESPAVLLARARLALEGGAPEDAETWVRRVLRELSESAEPHAPTRILVTRRLIECLVSASKLEEALALSRDHARACRQALGEKHPETVLADLEVDWALARQSGDAAHASAIERDRKPPRRTNVTPVNLDFEASEVGAAPEGWLNPVGRETFNVTTSDRPHAGSRCALLGGLDGISDVPDVPFRNLMQTVDATPYQGRRVRFRAAVRIDAKKDGDRAQLWLRVDRPGGMMGFFDNMNDRPISSSQWGFYEIVGEVGSDAKLLNFGLMALGEGAAYMDTVTLEAIGKVQ